MIGEHYDPHSVLGLHTYKGSKKVIRIWRPGAENVYIEVLGKIVMPQKVDPSGFFEVEVPFDLENSDYRVYHTSGLLANDPYSFLPSIGEVDLYLFNKGVHYQLYDLLGAHLITHQGVEGVRFVVWAPNAKKISLIADFNHWDGRVNPMRSMGQSGLWELFVPGLKPLEKYKFEIRAKSGALFVKADPYARSSEVRPETASIVVEEDNFDWSDIDWMKERSTLQGLNRPLSVYEVHLGSWRKKEGHFLNYQEIAIELANYCKEMGFTHVELMPVQEHPLDESWGYQVTGFYSVTSRFGTPSDFQWFINHMHMNGIGVILDWVPGHFPTDEFSLGRFDGTALYEHGDPKEGFHPHWNTFIFNFGRFEVVNFLIANALFWFEKMHVDGLRVDAVASMLYRDYGRKEGEWVPNKYGSKENLEAIEFFKHLNSVVHTRHPGVLMIAEESTSFAGVTQPVQYGGLGFDLKWNMGWMNDTLRYFQTDMLFRGYHQNDLTFGLLYAFSEKFMLVFSHDEVVHGKKSLLSKMPGDIWQKFANLRLLYSYMICQPGKKLMFMGGEIGQWNEWNCKSCLDWDLLHYPTHKGVQELVKQINHFYKSHPALWQKDTSFEGFEWVDFGDRQNSVLSYLRKGDARYLLCVHHFTPQYHNEYYLPLGNVRTITEVFNSDSASFGGSGKHCPHPVITQNAHGIASGVKIQLAPLATMIFEVEFYT